jgi:hypothetical protein
MDKIPIENLRFNYIQVGMLAIWNMDIFELMETIPTVPTITSNPNAFRGQFYCVSSSTLRRYMLEYKQPASIRRYLSDVLGKPIIP